MTIGGSSSAPHSRRSSRPSSIPRTGWSTSSWRTANSSTAASSPRGSTIAAARRTRSESEIRSRSVGIRPSYPRSEFDHAADPVLGLHQLEAVVDVVERDAVGDEGVDVDVAVQIALHEPGDLVAALDAAERGAGHAPAGDEQARDDVQRLALAGHAGHGAQAPAHARGPHRPAQHLDVAGGLERVVGAEAPGLVEHALHGVLAGHPGLRRALAA